MIDDDTFFAWLDGELDVAEAERVSAAVAADPALTAKAREHRDLGAMLKGTFDPVARQAPPEALLASLQSPVKVTNLAAERGKRSRLPPGQWHWPQLTALAASLMIGIVTGSLVMGGQESPIEASQGRLLASGTLERALDTQLASIDQTKTDVRIGQTFRDGTGQICRSFANSGSTGLACRNEDQWRLQALFAGEADRADYRMAAGTDPNLAALIDSKLTGEPFDAATERQALARDWR